MTTSHDIQLRAVADATAVCAAFVEEARASNAATTDDRERETSAMAVLVGTSALSILKRIGDRKPWNIEYNVSTGAAMKLRADAFTEFTKTFESQVHTWESNKKDDADEDIVHLAQRNVTIWNDLIARVSAVAET